MVVVVNFIYPKKNNVFKASQYSTQSVFNDLPKYSISVYDDANFIYKRQSQNGNQILSNIISDDLFPDDSNQESKTRYLTGRGTNSKIFYLKVLVNKPVPQDTPGNYSTIFYLAKTQIFGAVSTVYYSLRCIEKNQNYTAYTSVITIKKSDFISQFDGKIFLNLVGDYDVSVKFPIDLQINNSASTSISQISSATPQTLSSTTNNSAYFQTYPVSFSYYEYSDSQDFNFTYTNLVLTNSLFSTANTIINSNVSTGISLRFTFSGVYNISDFSYFGLTIQNTDPSYNPNVDTIYKIVFRTVEDEVISVEDCSILNNLNSGYYNVVFKLKNIDTNLNDLNYMLIQIVSTRTLTQNYSITYINFMTAITAGAFSVKSLQNNTQEENFTKDPFDKIQYIDNLKNQELIKSTALFTTVESLIEIGDEVVYEITTQSGKIYLPENAMIFTSNDFLPAYSLEQDVLILENDSFMPITSIKIMPPRKVKMIDIYENADYVLNGFYVKNPLFIKSFQRIFLERIETRKQNKSFLINDEKYFLLESEDFQYFSNEIVLKKGNHTIEFSPSAIYASILISGNSEIVVQSKIKQKVVGQNQKLQLDIDNKNFLIYLKSNSTITIHKLICKHES